MTETEVQSNQANTNDSDRSSSPPFHRHVLQSVVTSLKSIIKWIKETIHSTQPNTPDQTADDQELKLYLDTWLTSVDKPVCDRSDVIPVWFDPEKYARGRSFAMKNLLALLYAEQLTVVLLMSLPMLRTPLIFSGKSDTVDKAFRRYLSTVERVVSWYSQDIWDKDSKAYHNLLAVRGMHRRIQQDMQTCVTAQRNVTVQQFDIPSTTPLLDSVRADLAPYLPNTQQQQWLESFDSSDEGPFINQLGMSCTQLGFVGLMVLAPGKFGASRASSSDLDDFVYLWYMLGYQLGIDDQFNLCAGGYEKTRKRCEHIMRHIVLPSLATAGNAWRHMSQCVIGGIDKIMRQPSFEASLSYTLWTLNIPTPHIDSFISWAELPRIWLFKSVLCTLLAIPGVPNILGFLLRYRLKDLRRRIEATADTRRRL